MKLLFKKFNILLVLCFVLLLNWFSFQEVFANGKVNPNKQNKISNSETNSCLNAEYPSRYKKYIISVGVINAQAIEIPKPKYPLKAREKKISGEVKAEVLVDKTGKVIWARVNNGHPLFQNSVKKVVCQSTFKPATISGNPYAVNGLIIYRFSL